MILKHSTINLKFCNSLNSQHFQNCVKTEQHSCEDLMVMNFALQKLLRNRTIFRTLLRKAVCDRRIFLCGSLVKAFCYAKRSIVKILLRKTAYSVSGLRCFWPPRFLRGAYFAVHKRLEPNYNMLNLYNILIQVKNTIHANGVLIKI